MSDDEPCRIYFRLLDTPEGTVTVKMVANPPREEWDVNNLTPAQRLALHAYGGMLDAGTIVRTGNQPVQEEEPKVTTEAIEVRSFDCGNN